MFYTNVKQGVNMVTRKEVQEVLYYVLDNRPFIGSRKSTYLEKECHRLIHNINTIEKNIIGGLDMTASINKLDKEYAILVNKFNIEKEKVWQLKNPVQN